MQQACGTERHGNGHDSCGRLYGEGQDTTYEQIEEIAAVAPRGGSNEEIANRCHLVKVHLSSVNLQSSQTEQHERETHEEIAQVSISLGVDECHRQYDGRIYHQPHIEATATEDHDPCGEGRSDVGTHDDGYCLRQA